jgi:hypothetical protein
MKRLAMLSLLLAGCTGADGLVVVSVVANAPLAAIDHLHVVAKSQAFDVGSDVQLPTTFGMQLPHSYAGALPLEVSAIAAAGDTIASGTTVVIVRPGRRVEATVVLTVSAPPGDMAELPDMAAEPDMATDTPDLAEPPLYDMTQTSPDMAHCSTEGQICTVGKGACVRSGHIICTSSGAQCDVAAGAPDENWHTTAAPNGSWDWNCDGRVFFKYPSGNETQPGADGQLHCSNFPVDACPRNSWTYKYTSQAPSSCGREIIGDDCFVSSNVCFYAGSTHRDTQGCK